MAGCSPSVTRTSGPSPVCSRPTSTTCGTGSLSSVCADSARRAPVAFGVYVHIPFCARRCDYCAFATWTDRHHLMGVYAHACRREIAEAELPPASSVFFGGGTPSLLPADLLCSILDAVNRGPDAEVTVECNPDSVSEEAFAAYRAAGVTRLSFGAQSTAPPVLASRGRTHRPGALAAAVA